MARKNLKTSLNVDSVKHKDTRKNIPTHELRDFVREEENAPKAMLYPRDPSLDPQLVWKGKDEQDQQELSVPVVPIYIQEKIHPQAIVEEVRRDAARIRASADGVQEDDAAYGVQTELFADYNGLPEEFDQRVDFYHHDANWQNRMILGDSLMVMTSLAEKEGLKGKIQMIYIDPPYGIKFGSNWQVSTRKRDVKDGKAEDATRQPEQIRAFRDTWKLGIHSYLSYLRDRLVVARELLTETGSCFVQIGDENVHLVRCLLDEVFGSENILAQIAFVKTSGFEEEGISSVADYLIWYGKNKDLIKTRHLLISRSIKTVAEQFKFLECTDGTIVSLNRAQILGKEAIPLGKRFMAADFTGQGETKETFTITFDGRKFLPTHGRHWSTNLNGIESLRKEGRLFVVGDRLAWKKYLDDFPFIKLTNQWNDTAQGGMAIDKIYVVQTNDLVVERCILMTTDPGDLVLDPTCGSGTTAFVAEQWGRRWITIDTSRVALALARTRLMSARYDSYHLADQFPEWTQFGADDAGLKNYLRKHPPSIIKEKADIRKGFVYKRVPHVTLKSIANNPEIKEGMTREQIDATIARHAETETLYDQPYDDAKSVRVAGPFTVESLSPHRVLPADENMDGNITPSENQERGDFALMIIENLKKAGVQNTKKNERLKFETLEPFAGLWIQAKGTYEEKGTLKRAAVSIGPEHGTVGPGQIKEAAKEAVQGLGHDLLIVCGFAFDPHVSEEIKRYGSLTVLPTKMNPDLAMGDELLKKTGAGNLFMVFGEPDIDVIRIADNRIILKLKGVDVYDPTTGVIRSNSTDDIACWFIDTDYNGESFFVRHAYFTGGQEPYDNLKRALRSEINEEAWTMLYSTESRPFDIPEGGKIAVKVINHYGDEVLKVISIEKSENPF